jgi:hypothetical protein
MDEITALKKPSFICVKMNGFFIKDFVAPTSCIVLIVILLE